jgi:hypothetical protein
LSEQKPSAGRIVMYNHPGDKTGKYPPKQSPALVLYVHEDGACDLRVFTAPTWQDGVCVGFGGEYINPRAVQGDDAFNWQWPVRV